ncbi:MAG: AAA family ATPase [Clostridia bacterium]
MTESKIDVREALAHIDPARLNYQDWVNVGMALKDEGLQASDWDAWSRMDSKRYHAGECDRKWAGFNGSANPVTAGTIVHMAMASGWTPAQDEGRELEWDDVIGNSHLGDLVVVDRNWIEQREVAQPDDWNPAGQLVRYLENLFEASDMVGYVTESRAKEEDGKPIKYLPTTKGSYSRTAGELIEQLNKCGGDIGRVLGDYKPEAGAWIRFNPLDGQGIKNENVTEYRYALVESDELDIERQHAIIHEMELPVAVLVHSGGRSLHAIVRIGATDYNEYRKRVDYLYSVCQKNGLKVDPQNRNPSRLSRMPGVMRGGRKQFIVAENIGKADYNQWHDWIESVNDDLPDPKCLAEMWDNMPPLAPTLISGVLRQGHKMLLAGPSKAGKSYALIELCCAIAEGKKWLTWPCAQGRVLYVNLELDEASCWNRIKSVYKALGYAPDHTENLDVWNLRGKAIPMDKLAPKLIRRAAKKHYIAIVIDPIYKIITGDENSADQMANFCNQFDKVCTELGCAVIYCHHHSKGQQGAKRSMDRASGSGVFARDPDAMMDMIQLAPNESTLKLLGDRAVCATCAKWMEWNDEWTSQMSQDARCSAPQMLEMCRRIMQPATYAAMLAAADSARESAEKRTAWRIEGTLREFERFEPIDLWFDHPVHHVDDIGCLKDVDADGESAVPPWQKALKARKEGAKSAQKDAKTAFEEAIQNANFGSPPTKKEVAQYLDVSERTVADRLKNYGGYAIDKNNGYVIVPTSCGGE